MSIATS